MSRRPVRWPFARARRRSAGGGLRPLPPTWADLPRFAGDYIYYFAQQAQNAAREGRRLVVRRIRPDGSRDEPVWEKDFFRGSVSPSGRCLALLARSPAEESWPLYRLRIVDWQSGRMWPVCVECIGWWSDDGAWFIIAKETGAGEEAGTTLIPVRPGTELPDLPPNGFASSADAAHAKGARLINATTNLAIGPTPETYVFVRETVHRNLYRIPLRASW